MKIEGPRPHSLLNKREAKAILKGEFDFPRKEYEKGILKLEFKHTFSTGEVLEAKEDEEGIATFVIKRGVAVIVDFGEFLPVDSKMVTPTYLNSHRDIWSNTDHKLGEWGENGFIAVGDVRKLRDIFVLLHEIGHSRQGLNWQTTMKRVKLMIDSGEERGAWSTAIRIARDIKEKTNINLFEAFKNKSDFVEFMYGGLLSYKLHGRFVLASQGIKPLWEFISNILFKTDSEDARFIDKLFDKGRIRRIPQTENNKTDRKMEGK